jgi:hypothetical protein
MKILEDSLFHIQEHGEFHEKSQLGPSTKLASGIIIFPIPLFAFYVTVN